MPAPISSPMQAKIIELYENGSKIKEIAQAVAVGRNAVARIVQAYIDKNANAPKAIGEVAFSAAELFKLRYFLTNRLRIGVCPDCGANYACADGDAVAFCTGCKTFWRFENKKQA